jgi:hypothetical protein
MCATHQTCERIFQGNTGRAYSGRYDAVACFFFTILLDVFTACFTQCQNTILYLTRYQWFAEIGFADPFRFWQWLHNASVIVDSRKSMEIRDRMASLKLQVEALDRNHDETAELACKVFELSQTLRQQWLTAEYAEKRRILEISV